MCGIIGYVGSRASKPLLLAGLKRLEYRGYDSAGIALLEEGGLDYVRAVGNLQFLKDKAGPNGSVSTTGLGHTRWATHGGVTEQNAHPLTACDDEKMAIVLNGIIENYRELREELIAAGLLLCAALKGRRLSVIGAAMNRFPQVKENVRVDKRELTPAIIGEVERLNREWKGVGRVLVRPSGTEPLIRVLAEAQNADLAAEACASIAALVHRELG